MIRLIAKRPFANFILKIEQLIPAKSLRRWNNTCSGLNKTLDAILLIHGGAGDFKDVNECGKLEGMKEALRCGKEHLWPCNGNEGNALNAVEAAIRKMEEDANFNCGYGACLNLEGKVELDASIMEGKELKVGCVTLLQDILHPISVARRVMEKSAHAFMGESGAKRFALQQGFEEKDDGSLVTQNALAALKAYKEKGAYGEPNTVGAVAIDANGNIVAATSTAGLTGKLQGRIGDSPILGCGTYADNSFGGVSTTGHGESIMRFNLAQKILSKIRYEQKTAQQATEEACKEMTDRLNYPAGAIAIDSKGQIGIYWTCKRMAWAYTRGNDIVCSIKNNEQFTDEL